MKFYDNKIIQKLLYIYTIFNIIYIKYKCKNNFYKFYEELVGSWRQNIYFKLFLLINFTKIIFYNIQII
jgi:hypothetical protein